MIYDRSQMQVMKRHPIRGAIFGLVFGLGVALFLIGQKIVAFGTLPPVLVIVGGLVLGLLWGLFAPAKEPVGGPPVPQYDAYVAPDVRIEQQWSDDMAAPSGEYGVPAGSYEVPGGEYAEPVPYEERPSAPSDYPPTPPTPPPPPPPPAP